MYTNQFENLCNAVVKQAADDYRVALRSGTQSAIEELEMFFCSEAINIYTNLNGIYLMNRIKETI